MAEPVRASERGLSATEFAAILSHQMSMSVRLGRQVKFHEALEDFERNHREAWARDRLLRDMAEQKDEIDRYKWLASEKQGHDIGFERAHAEWVDSYAAAWRTSRESFPSNGFEERRMKVSFPEGLHVRLASQLVEVANRFPCHVFVHNDAMQAKTVVVNGTGFVNAKSLMGIFSLGAIQGDQLHFVAYGERAGEALGAVSEFLSGGAS